MVRAYDRGSPSKDRAPKGRAYRSSTGLVSQPVILAFCATILLLLSVAGYNTHLLLKHSRHKDRASVTAPRPLTYKVGAERFSDFLKTHQDFHVDQLPSPPSVHTAVSLSLQHIESQIGLSTSAGSEGIVIEKLCEQPRVFLLHNFISDDEATHLMSAALPKLEKALVVEPGHVEQTTTLSRTNSAAWLKRRSDPVVLTVENRIAWLTATRVEQGEDLQVLHYDVGEQFTAHHDYFDPMFYPKSLSSNGGHRMATMLIYLQSALAGGQTSFPRAAVNGLNVTASAGDAILFFDVLRDGQPDVMSQHAGLPVLEGEKWIATKWIHLDDFSHPAPQAVAHASENS